MKTLQCVHDESMSRIVIRHDNAMASKEGVRTSGLKGEDRIAVIKGVGA